MILSKFAHKLEKNGYVARFNSLKNVPVYYEQELDLYFEDYLLTGNVHSSIEKLIKELCKNKVLVPDKEYDDRILNLINDSIPKPYPTILYLILTEKCNFACDYCFIERYMDQSKTNTMTMEIAKKAIDFFVKQIHLNMKYFEEEKSILFYGGEPLINFEVLEYAANLIKEYKKLGLLPEKTSMGMVTNGTCITNEIARKLNELNVSFSVSLDGSTCSANSCRKYHNGKMGFQDILRGIRIAKDENCDIGLSMTLSQEALRDSDKIFDLINEYDIKSLGFNILLSDKTYVVPDEYFEKVSEFIIDAYKIFRKKGIYEDRIMRKVNAFINHNLHYQDCAAEGGNQLVVAPNGDIGLCHGYLSTRETFVTNVDDQTFIIHESPLFLEWNKRTPLQMKQCIDCKALGTCGGGCALNAKANGRSIWDLDERFCIHSKSTIDFLVWDLFDKIKQK